jgi:hypothetical protein
MGVDDGAELCPDLRGDLGLMGPDLSGGNKNFHDWPPSFSFPNLRLDEPFEPLLNRFPVNR